MNNIFSVIHSVYGLGTAILIKHRRKPELDLFMCSFKGLEGKKEFYCRKHIDEGSEVWWDDGRRSRKKKTKERRKPLSSFSGDGFIISGFPRR